MEGWNISKDSSDLSVHRQLNSDIVKYLTKKKNTETQLTINGPSQCDKR